MTDYEALVLKIEEQQKGKEGLPEFMIGEQLKDIARNEPSSADILNHDFDVPEMGLEAAAKKLQEYSDKNHKGSKVFCITPMVAEAILREFYGLAKRTETAEKPMQNNDLIDISDFFS